MIHACARQKLTEEDRKFVAAALCREGEKETTIKELLNDPEMRDALLDHPKLLEFLLHYSRTTSISPFLYFYVLVRNSLREHGLDDRQVADYVAAMLAEFGKEGRAHRVSSQSTKEYHYLVDLMADLVESDSMETFYLRSHLGNYALFLTGMFPDRIHHRVKYHAPAPGFRYYEQVGRTSFHLASRHRMAERYQLSEILEVLGRNFVAARHALNHVADNYLTLDRNPGVSDKVMRRVQHFIDRKQSN